MIMTSYSSLVIESHRQTCAGLIGGVAGIFRRRAADEKAIAPLSSQPAVLTTLTPPPVLTSDVVELVPGNQGGYRGAA